MESTYTTRQGDTWDSIAYRVYGDETLAGWVMQNNYPQLETFVFSAGTVLQVPEPPVEMPSSNAPIWRTET